MSNISHFLKQIMQARYGKDVRQSIHDAIQEIDAVADTAQDSATASAKAAADTLNMTVAMADSATASAKAAADSAAEAESYAHGGTGTREDEDLDNAKRYYEQAKQISQGMSGLIPIGTITFAELAYEDNQVAKYMFNISEEFVTDDTFKEGSGYKYPAGTNVYRTADGYWDCLAGAFLALNGDSKDNAVTFASQDSTSPTAWTDVTVLTSGEKHSSLFSKISTMFKNIRWLYKMLGTTDISTIGGGTVTGAISSQNEALATLNTNLNQKTSGQFVLPNGLKMCWGTRLQGESLLDIQFPFVFSSEPHVFVSSRWLTSDTNNLCFVRVTEVHVHKFNALEHYSDTNGETWYGRHNLTNGINWFAIGF